MRSIFAVLFLLSSCAHTGTKSAAAPVASPPPAAPTAVVAQQTKTCGNFTFSGTRVVVERIGQGDNERIVRRHVAVDPKDDPNRDMLLRTEPYLLACLQLPGANVQRADITLHFGGSGHPQSIDTLVLPFGEKEGTRCLTKVLRRLDYASDTGDLLVTFVAQPCK